MKTQERIGHRMPSSGEIKKGWCIGQLVLQSEIHSAKVLSVPKKKSLDETSGPNVRTLPKAHYIRVEKEREECPRTREIL